MKRLIAGVAIVLFLLSTKSHAQSAAVNPPPDAGHGSQASCVILKRMGRIGRTGSRLYHFGISGKQFRYVEGKLPEGFSFHEKMTDLDVRDMQARGAQVLVLDSHYTAYDLKEARAACPGQAGKAPNQVEAKASVAPAPASTASTPAPPPKPPTAKPAAATTRMPKAHDSVSSAGTDAALLDVSSTPTEADVYVDDHLSGRTPSTLILMPGDHKIVIKKSGFDIWKRTINLPSGRINLDADLVPKGK
ncbi:MAG TPA: PEGA domain-containing protein [Candidatus Acidoferrum sp.]|nr:PEGA domain-containing protein [Candidatus Acidoferrum sp.]